MTRVSELGRPTTVLLDTGHLVNLSRVLTFALVKTRETQAKYGQGPSARRLQAALALLRPPDARAYTQKGARDSMSE